MKNRILKIFSIFAIALMIGCKAQQIYPLQTYYGDVSNGSYIKDINNDYNQFIGTWKANYDNKEITLKITKVIKKPFTESNKTYYSDVLIVQHLIKDNTGNVIENYISSDLNNYKIISNMFHDKIQNVFYIIQEFTVM